MHEMGKFTKTIDAHILVRYLVANFVIYYFTKVRPQPADQSLAICILSQKSGNVI